MLDEAHCISNSGHDFRSDYRHVHRFIQEFSGDSPAPVRCLTATAKPEVARDIRDHVQARLGVDLMQLGGGAVRTSLSFAVLPTQKASKAADWRLPHLPETAAAVTAGWGGCCMSLLTQSQCARKLTETGKSLRLGGDGRGGGTHVSLLLVYPDVDSRTH